MKNRKEGTKLLSFVVMLTGNVELNLSATTIRKKNGVYTANPVEVFLRPFPLTE